MFIAGVTARGTDVEPCKEILDGAREAAPVAGGGGGSHVHAAAVGNTGIGGAAGGSLLCFRSRRQRAADDGGGRQLRALLWPRGCHSNLQGRRASQGPPRLQRANSCGAACTAASVSVCRAGGRFSGSAKRSAALPAPRRGRRGHGHRSERPGVWHAVRGGRRPQGGWAQRRRYGGLHHVNGLGELAGGRLGAAFSDTGGGEDVVPGAGKPRRWWSPLRRPT
ncbi:unnamed protein product [Phaeothamnion confervicola]